MRRLTEATDAALYDWTGYGLTFWMAWVCAALWLVVLIWFGAALVMFRSGWP